MFTLAGCAGSESKSDVALAKAQKAVDTALDGWTRGERPDKFACQDPDWEGGAKLLSFLTSSAELVGTDADQVRCRVALTLKDRQGRKRDRQVQYFVHLSDPPTIRREAGKP